MGKRRGRNISMRIETHALLIALASINNRSISAFIRDFIIYKNKVLQPHNSTKLAKDKQLYEEMLKATTKASNRGIEGRKRVNVSLTDNELNLLQEKANESGMSMSNYIFIQLVGMI